MKRRVLDFDRTVYDGDSTAGFYRRCLLRYPRVALDLPLSCWYFLAMWLGLVSKTRAKERFYRFLRYVPDVEAETQAFWAANVQKIKRWYLESRRSDDLIVSASPEFLLLPICDKLQVSLLASRVDPKTGETQGLNCHGEEKRRRLLEACPDIEIESFYSDALSDAPLARMAGQAFFVRGERVLPWPTL